MAVRIDRVEREFILRTGRGGQDRGSAQGGGPIGQGQGRSAGRRERGLLDEWRTLPSLRASWSPYASISAARRSPSRRPCSKAAAGNVELGLPESMYRSLSRRWPRVALAQGPQRRVPPPGRRARPRLPRVRDLGRCRAARAPGGPGFQQPLRPRRELQGQGLRDSERGARDHVQGSGPSRYRRGDGRQVGAGALRAFHPRAPAPSPTPIRRAASSRGRWPRTSRARPPRPRARGWPPIFDPRPWKACVSGLWCPVVYFSYTVGIVYMANEKSRAMSLDFRRSTSPGSSPASSPGSSSATAISPLPAGGRAKQGRHHRREPLRPPRRPAWGRPVLRAGLGHQA